MLNCANFEQNLKVISEMKEKLYLKLKIHDTSKVVLEVTHIYFLLVSCYTGKQRYQSYI